MSVVKCLDAATGHVTQGDVEILDACSGNPRPGYPVVYGYEYGWFIPVGVQTEFPESGLSESFAKLMRYASNQECRLIWLDRDAEIIESEELDSHDW